MPYKTVRHGTENVSPLNGRTLGASVIINMQDKGRFIREAYIRMENYMENKAANGKKDYRESRKKKMRMGTILGWLVLAAVVLIAVPVGVIMLMVSGIWSAADRILARFGK